MSSLITELQSPDLSLKHIEEKAERVLLGKKVAIRNSEGE